MKRIQELIRKVKSVMARYPWAMPLVNMGWNLVLAVFYIILTFRNSSWWYFTLCMFFLALGLMRMRVLLAERMGRSQTTVMRGIGISLALFSIVICGTTYLTIHEHQNPNAACSAPSATRRSCFRSEWKRFPVWPRFCS